MSRTQLKAIFVALGVLVLAYAGTRLLGDRSGGSGGSDEIGGAVTADVARISIGGRAGGATTELTLSDQGWTVNGYPADSALVREAIAGLDTARVGRLVARSAVNHARLGVSEDSARLVEIGSSSNPVVRFHFGHRGREGRFVRFLDDEAVYVVPEASVGMLDRELDAWRNRLIAALDTSAISRIVVRRADESRETMLIRSEDAWAEDGVAADSATVAALLAAVGRLEAEGFPTDSVAFAADFDDPVAVLEVYDSDAVGAAPGLSLLFLAVPVTRAFLVRRADDPLVYGLSEGAAEVLLPPRPRLFPEG